LTHPEVTLGVEVREDRAFIFTDTVKAAGGLPVGTQPKVVCLLSDDLNSSVACWMVMKRGCPILPLHFNEAPLSKEDTKRALKSAEALFKWTTGFPRRFYIVSHGSNLAHIEQNCPLKLRSVISKRLMYRIAERLAEIENAEGIVTGESLNEPAGEALHVLRLQDEAAKNFPVYRPLIGLDTPEIEELARKIGMHDAAAQKVEKGKVALKKHVAISTDEVSRAEKKLNIDELVKESLETIKTLSL
jgi:thiamine biosynthesis protein ThiI